MMSEREMRIENRRIRRNSNTSKVEMIEDFVEILSFLAVFGLMFVALGIFFI